MSYVEFCAAYWQAGYHWPYPVPRLTDPTNNASYTEFVELLGKLGQKPDEYDRALNLIRASYDYLAGLEGKRVELPQVLSFLRQPWQNVLAQLTSYQPVFQWLLAAHMLLDSGDEKDMFREHRVQGAIERATYLLQDCLAFKCGQLPQKLKPNDRLLPSQLPLIHLPMPTIQTKAAALLAAEQRAQDVHDQQVARNQQRVFEEAYPDVLPLLVASRIRYHALPDGIKFSKPGLPATLEIRPLENISCDQLILRVAKWEKEQQRQVFKNRRLTAWTITSWLMAGLLFYVVWASRHVQQTADVPLLLSKVGILFIMFLTVGVVALLLLDLD